MCHFRTWLYESRTGAMVVRIVDFSLVESVTGWAPALGLQEGNFGLQPMTFGG